MDTAIEDALVNWFETEQLARTASSDARRGEVIQLASARQRSPALDRLFKVIEDALDGMSMLKPQVEPAHNFAGAAVQRVGVA